MDFAEIAVAFSRPAMAALMAPAPLTTQASLLGRSTATHTVRSTEFRQTLERAMHRAVAPRRNVASPEQDRAAGSENVPRAPYRVRQGDTLSTIVRRALESEKTPGSAPTEQEVLQGVARVAAENRLADPDFILPGQELDLAALGEDGVGGPAEVHERSLVDILSEVFGDREEHVHDDYWAPTLDGSARVSSEYGYRRDPFTGAPDFHHGVDLAAKSGTSILAFRAGVVTFSGHRAGYGRTVVVQHDDGYESVYAHASENLVAAGERVEAGTPLALVGSTGRSTGPHLHFEVRRHGKPVDPVPHLERAARLQLAAR